MGFCFSSEDRKEIQQELDINGQYQGMKQLSTGQNSESKLVTDRQTRETFILHNIYTHSEKHQYAMTKEDAFLLFDTLRKSKHLNIATVWQVGHSKLDMIYVV